MDCRMDIAKKSNNMLKLLFTNLFFLDQKSKKKATGNNNLTGRHSVLSALIIFQKTS